MKNPEVIKTEFQLINDIGEIISGDLFIPSNAQNPMPLVIISHGFKAWKDWGFYPYVSEKIADAGAIVVCFNFSLNGNPDVHAFIRETEKFAKNTVSQEINDLEAVINAFTISGNQIFSNVKNFWNGNIFLLGHSMGAAVSLLTMRTNANISKTVLWASIAKFDRYTERQKKLWQEKGFLEFSNYKTKQILRMNVKYLDDIENNRDLFHLPSAISELSRPALIVHGLQDVTVPVREAEELIEADNNNILQVYIIEKTGHTFGIAHPFKRSSPYLERAINKTFEFFELNNKYNS